jgi:hypothetical protein
MKLPERLAELPQQWGGKQSSQGNTQYWRGYQLHFDEAEGQILISVD